METVDNRKVFTKLNLIKPFQHELLAGSSFKCICCKRKSDVGVEKHLKKYCLKCFKQVEELPVSLATASKKLYMTADYIYARITTYLMQTGELKDSVPLEVARDLWSTDNASFFTKHEGGGITVGKGKNAIELKSEKEAQFIQFYVMNKLLRDKDRRERVDYIRKTRGNDYPVSDYDLPRGFFCPLTFEKLNVQTIVRDVDFNIIVTCQSPKMFGKRFVFINYDKLIVE